MLGISGYQENRDKTTMRYYFASTRTYAVGKTDSNKRWRGHRPVSLNIAGERVKSTVTIRWLVSQDKSKTNLLPKASIYTAGYFSSRNKDLNLPKKKKFYMSTHIIHNNQK